MIDSVTIHVPEFILYSDKHFTKAQYQELRGDFGIFGRHSTRYTTHAQTCKADGRYFPQVHIIERSRRTKQGMTPHYRRLVIQVSLPKLLFGTNIFDFDVRLLTLTAQKLTACLKEIDVGISVEQVLKAVVYRVDYSKILQISPSFGTTDQLLRALAPYDLKQSSDFNRSHYHDGRDGFYVKFYNSSQGFVIYDKFDEIVANGKTKLEQAIAREYKAGTWTKGALRIELSLQKKQTVDSILRRYISNKKKDFTLQEIARIDIARDCLVEVYERVYVKDFNRLVRLSDLKNTELEHLIEEQAKDFRDRAILYYLAHQVRKHGLKSTIERLKRETSLATVGRYKRVIETILSKVEAKKDTVNAVSYLYRKLKIFHLVLPKNLRTTLEQVAEEAEER